MTLAWAWEVKVRRREMHLSSKEEEKSVVIYLDQFSEALEIKTNLENHWHVFSYMF